jgi:hypothetical protein
MNDLLEYKLHFLLIDQMGGFFFNPHRREGLKFTMPEPDLTVLSLQPSDPERDDSGLGLGLTCKVHRTFTVPQPMYDFARSLLDGRFEPRGASGLKLPHVVNGDEKINSSGLIQKGYHVPFRYR